MRRKLLVLMALLVTVALGAACSPPPAPPLPPQMADAYPVGLRTITAVDTARPFPGRAPLPAAPTRVMTVYVWYPAAYGAVSDNDYSNATPRSQRFPVVVFAHGFNSSPEPTDAWHYSYQPFLHKLAAQGFVVAAPVFPMESYIPGAAAPVHSDAEMINQMYDMSAVISAVQANAAQPGNWMSTVTDASKVGVVGHSDGAMTVAGMVMSTSYNDPRIDTAVVMNGAGLPELSWNYRHNVGLLVEQATQDPYNNPANAQWLYNQVTGPREYLTVYGNYHIWPLIGNDTIADLTRRVVVGHLNAGLKGELTFGAMNDAGNRPGYTSLQWNWN